MSQCSWVSLANEQEASRCHKEAVQLLRGSVLAKCNWETIFCGHYRSIFNHCNQSYLIRWNNIKTRKRGNCECIAIWGRPTPRQSFPALTTTPCQVWSRWTNPLPYIAFLFAAETLLYAVTLTFDTVTLTFDLWPWTFVVYRLWPDETLFQIWVKSSNPRRSYCDLNVWPYDLEHV